jgi:hypothetical protein
MKPYQSFAFLLFMLYLPMCAQKTQPLKAKLHADGKVKESEHKPSIQYYFYVEMTTTLPPDIKTLWINGTAYKVTKQLVNGPVVFPRVPGLNNTITVDTIIKANEKKIWRIELNGIDAANKQKSQVATLLKSNAVVMEYLYKGRWYQWSSKQITRLSPMITQ